MTLAQLQKEGKDLLAADRWSELFALLNKNLQTQSEAARKTAQLQGRHSKAYQAQMMGLLSTADATLEFNQVRYSLLELLGGLSPADLGDGQGASPITLLDELVRALRVEVPLTPLFLVNCDRQRELRTFRRSFSGRQQEGCRFQFYFVLACPTQEPEGFAERVVYELIGEHAGSHHHSVQYPRNDANGRVRIEPLPIGLTLPDAKDAFKKYFATRFATGATDFEDYLRQSLPFLQTEYVATALRITAGDWDSDIIDEYLQWLMDGFAAVEGCRTTFLFFFIVTLKNAHCPEKIRRDDEAVLRSVAQLMEKNAPHATLISPLPPVPTDDLEEWLEKLGQVSQAEKNALIAAIAATLPAEASARLHQEQLLDMEPIEDLQERVYQRHH